MGRARARRRVGAGADSTVRLEDRRRLRALHPRGIAVSNVRYRNPGVKPVALARRAGGPFIEASNATLISQEYPLVRIIPAYVDKVPGAPVEPAVREFLRYVLSREGQRALIEESGYLPLGPRAISAQLEKLE